MWFENIPPNLLSFLSGITGGILAIIGNYILSRPSKSQERKDDSDTFLNLSEVAEQATQTLKEVQKENLVIRQENASIKKENAEIRIQNNEIKQENARIKQMIGGVHRLVIEYSPADLVQNGQASITSGKVEIVGVAQ